MTKEEYMNTNAHLEAELAVMRLQLALAREALSKIENPIKHMRANLKEGQMLNGSMAVGLSNNSEYLKGIAKTALAAIDDTKLLDGYVLCDAKHVAWVLYGKTGTYVGVDDGTKRPETEPLYARRKP